MELGFKPDHLFKAGLSLTSVKYESDDAKTVAFWEVTTKIRQIFGILAGLLLARFIEALLYGASACDPITIGLTILVLGIASLLACLLPAVKAVRINPTKVLNEQHRLKPSNEQHALNRFP